MIQQPPKVVRTFGGCCIIYILTDHLNRNIFCLEPSFELPDILSAEAEHIKNK